ncbi:MAG TPA: TraR/DksA C4-type zinc finger protein [Thermodesulfovibrionales bacterium]|nr:TraR/DksA C4-type zinc finger protein [Thermodesulfovibrionales bacterium]
MKKKIKPDAGKNKPKTASGSLKKRKVGAQKNDLEKGPVRKKNAGGKKIAARPAAKMMKKVAKSGATTKLKGAEKAAGATRKMGRGKTSREHARRELLRKLLIQKREEIVKEAKEEIAKFTKGEANQLAETALDDGDWSVIDLSQDINLRRLETHRESLLGIDEALMKLREGSYGVCEDCGGEISAERLNVMPFAIYCKDCREKREELEKATRETTIS